MGDETERHAGSVIGRQGREIDPDNQTIRLFRPAGCGRVQPAPATIRMAVDDLPAGAEGGNGGALFMAEVISDAGMVVAFLGPWRPELAAATLAHVADEHGFAIGEPSITARSANLDLLDPDHGDPLVQAGKRASLSANLGAEGRGFGALGGAGVPIVHFD